MEQKEEINDNKKKTWKGVNIQQGVVHLQQLLNEEEQKQLLKGIQIANVVSGYKPTSARNKNSHFLKTLAFDCKKQYDKVPQCFKDFSARATMAAHEIDEIIPHSYIPDYCTSFTYQVSDGRLTGHVDKVLGWVVLFSLGNIAKFYIKGPLMNKREVIDFRSGDVLVFNGGTEYDIYHGIDDIVPNTCPVYLPELGDVRISLQLRQSERNDNKIYHMNKKAKQTQEEY